MKDTEFTAEEGEERSYSINAAGTLCAVGTALSQTWVLPVGLISDMYRQGDLAIWITGSMLLPFFISFALVSGGFVAARITTQWNQGIYGAFTGAASVITGSIILLALLGLPGPTYLLWTLAGVLAGAGGGLLFIAWSTRMDSFESNQRTPIFFVSIILCSLLAIWAQYQGLGSLLLIMASVGSLVSAILFAASSNQPNIIETFQPPLGLLPGFLRVFIAFMLFGLVFAMMIMQFLIAPHGRALSRTWILSLLGIAAVIAFVQIGKRFRSAEWDGLLVLRFAPIPVLIAFYPFNAGSDFSLKFAMGGAAFALWFFLTLAPLIASNAADTLRVPFSLIWATGFGALSLGASMGICVAAVVESVLGLNYVSVTAIASMVLAVLASDILLTRGSLARIYKRAYMTNAENENESSEGSLDHRVAMITDAYNLTSREGEVLGILARGHGLNRVQETLYIAEGTAITHRRHIYQKLGIHSKTELIDFVSHYGDEHCDDD